MKLPLNIARKYTDLPSNLEETLEIIATRIGEVESYEDLNKKYEGITIAEVIKKEDHPDADKLAVYNITLGEKENTQIVAGDKKVNVGDKVAYIKPGAIVPNTYRKEAFKIQSRKLRGIQSNGMICSEKELDIGANHEHVLILEPEAPVGEDFAKYYEMNDVVVEIENKALTNRGDLFGIIGLAREIAATQGISFKSPNWYKEIQIKIKPEEELPLEVRNEAKAVCPRYCAVSMSNVKIEESPIWLKSTLLKSGIKPINNVVDITNYVMILTGQPMHAFDYDKVKGEDHTAEIIVRIAKSSEKIHTLDGNLYELNDRNLVIADNKHPIALAGIVGGVDTQIDENTKNIILECAIFDRYNIRRTSMDLGVITDSSTRFTRAQSREKCDKVMTHAVELINQLANGSIGSGLIDSYSDSQERKSISINIKRMLSRLGLEITIEEVIKILTDLEYENTKVKRDYITTQIPTFRQDIEIEEDVYEDIVRIYGYEKINPVLPKDKIKSIQFSPILQLKNTISNILSYSGSNELISYSFLSSDIISLANQDPNSCFKIKNPLSKELEFMRPSILVSLLDKAKLNTQEGIETFSIYEMGISHQRGILDDENLPLEEWKLSLIFSDTQNLVEGNPYYQARTYLEKVLNNLRIKNINYELLSETDSSKQDKWINILSSSFELNSSALVYTKIGVTKIALGVVGEIKNSVKRDFGLNNYTSGFEINLERLLDIIPKGVINKSQSKFPYITQDICFVVPESISYAELYKRIENVISQKGFRYIIECIDIYKHEKDNNRKVTLRISITNIKKTLRDKDFKNFRDEMEREIQEKGISMLQ